MNRFVLMLMMLVAFAVAASCSSSEQNSVANPAVASGEPSGTDGAGLGGSSSSSSGVEGTEPEDTTSSVPDPEQVSIDDLEQRWAEARSQIANRIRVAGFGLDSDGSELTGPASFAIDLSDCPSDWQDEVEDGPINLAVVLPQSGSLSELGEVAEGMAAYIDYVNQTHGGVAGRQIELLVGDDGYDPDLTADIVDDFLDQPEVFSITTLGSPTTLEVYEDINDACVPNPLVMSPHPAWGDPENHPWTTGLQLSYTTEALLWGAWIEDNLGDDLPVTVAALVLDNENGHAFQEAFEQWVEIHPEVVEDFIVERHQGPVSSVADEIEELTESNPDVYISMTFGNACIEALREADRTGLADDVLAIFNPSVCRDVGVYLDPVGDSADGVYIVDGGWKLASDPRFADDPFMLWSREILDDAGLDPDGVLHTIGFAQYGWTLIEALRVAAEIDDEFRRSNFILGMRSFDVDHPFASPGVSMTMNGLRDSYLVEGSAFAQFSVDEGAWVESGLPIDIDGTTPACEWTRRTCG